MEVWSKRKARNSVPLVIFRVPTIKDYKNFYKNNARQ